MKNVRIVTCLLVSLVWIYSEGQVIYPEPVKLPSSEAQSLGEFSEIPVDLHTGRVNIEIPLYSVHYGDITVPISISYHGGGIKVTDESGAVGLGWTLNAGGVVNRIVRGKPDEMNDNEWRVFGYNQLTSDYFTIDGLSGSDFLHFLTSVKNNQLEGDPSSMLFAPLAYPTTNEFAQMGYAYDEGHFDASPDNYTFSLQNLSGTFVQNGGNMILQTNAGCSISFDRETYSIIDKNGLQYDCNEKEDQLYPYYTWYKWEQYEPDIQNQRLRTYKYTSSWWLSNIHSLAGDSVCFEYDEVPVLHKQPTQFGYYQRRSFDEQNRDFYITNKTSNPYGKNDTTYHKIIRAIETPLCKVIFSYISNNEFIYPKLGQMVVYSKDDLKTPVESYEFLYSGNHVRSLLKKVVRTGRYGETQSHVFNYQTKYGVEFPLEKRDHWGYYSPQSTGMFPMRCTEYNDQILGGNRDYSERFANDSTADNCMLTSIKYPSGLTTNFKWEPNDFGTLSYAGQRALHDENYDDLQYETTYTKTDKFSLCGKELAEHTEEHIALNERTTLLIDMTQYYATAKDTTNDYHSCIMEWNATGSLTNRTSIEVRRGSTLVAQYYVSDHTSEIVELDLPSGNYTIRLNNPRCMVREDGGTCSSYYDEFFRYAGIDDRPDGYVHITCCKTQTQISRSQARTVGGVRIKEITYQSNNKVLLSKQYSYVLSDGVTSSGVLAYPPRYFSYYNVYESKYIDESWDKVTALMFHSSKCLIMSSYGLPSTLNAGSHIEYSRVIERITSLGANMNQITHNYTSADTEDYSDVVDFDTHQRHAIPSSMLQLTSRNYMRGNEVSTEMISDEVVHTSREYEVLEKANADTIHGAIYPFADYEKTGYIYMGNIKPYKNYGMVYYRLIPYNKRLKNTVSHGSKSGNKIDLYEYPSNQYSSSLNANMPTIHKTLTSEGDTLIEHYSYLPNSGRIASYAKTKKSSSSSLEYVVDAYRIEYDTYNRPLRKWVANLQQGSLPTSLSNIETLATDLVETCNYYQNRIVQKTNVHTGITTVVLWSYACSYPIAEIENATWEQVVSLIGENTISNLFSAIEPDMTMVDALRNSMPNSRVRTYTYRPLIGILSSTDENGITTYYDYDGFGNLSEIYILENGTKKILEHQDYHWNN